MTCPTHMLSSLFCCTARSLPVSPWPIGLPLAPTSAWMMQICTIIQLTPFSVAAFCLFCLFQVCWGVSFNGRRWVSQNFFFYFTCVVSHIEPSLFFSLLPLLPVLRLKVLQCKSDIRKKPAGIVEGGSKWMGWLLMALHVLGLLLSEGELQSFKL